MPRTKGWIFDVYVEDERAVLWVKTADGRALRLMDRYTPSFYMKPRDDVEAERLVKVLEKHPHIVEVREEFKYLSLSANCKSRVLHVFVDSARNFRAVLNDVRGIGAAEAYFNTDLLHVQRYLFEKSLPPTCMTSMTYDDECMLRSFSILDDSLKIGPPPFTTMIFDISTEWPSRKARSIPVTKITVYDPDLRPIKAFDGSEAYMLQSFAEYVEETDPDFLAASNIEESLTHILMRARRYGLNIQLGRERVNVHKLRRLLPYALKGRSYVDLDVLLSIGLEGLVERSRWTLVPPRLAAKWPAGKIIDSRQCYEAMRRDILIPESYGFYQYPQTVKEVIFRDRGGLIFSPKVGLHKNVGELDFESMYPNIIVRYNISYETVSPDGIERNRKGLLPHLVETVLARRLYFKHLREKFPRDSREWRLCDNRQKALKNILVCIYGYSGCFANRFGNVRCYEEINQLARENLIKAVNIALKEGYEVIYGDSDSLFVKKEDASREDYENLAEKIRRETGLPIRLDHHYKFLVFLRQSSDEKFEAARRYYGKLTDGSLYYRGIELRRHDTPAFMKEFQERLISILFDADSAEEIISIQLKKAIDYVLEACRKIRRREVPIEKLIINKVLRKEASKYRSKGPHVIAALQEAQRGKPVRSGDIINLIYVNARHKNPFRRVIPADMMLRNQYYDREKYVKMVLDAAKTILGVFGTIKKIEPQIALLPRKL
ncbi:MAG TPA: hypothetical protein ENG65_02205 [Candidatus Bathyarchaeota archaeon]|nr:hypothetical protein [Candidatus Bathyarchaeota archaeon]